MSAHLGTGKDLEKLVRRAGGAVEVLNSNHLRWSLPNGWRHISGLTMSSGSVRNARRTVERALAGSERTRHQ